MHHALSVTALQRHENSVLKLAATLRGFTNPFAVYDLFNLVTKKTSYLKKKVKQDLCKQGEIEQELFETFVARRIKISSETFLGPNEETKVGYRLYSSTV